jgi:hypothetical protein
MDSGCISTAPVAEGTLDPRGPDEGTAGWEVHVLLQVPAQVVVVVVAQGQAEGLRFAGVAAPGGRNAVRQGVAVAGEEEA